MLRLRFKKCAVVLVAALGFLTLAAPQLASAAPTAPAVAFTSGWQCSGGNEFQCGLVNGAGLHINYLTYGAYNKIAARQWCGFIEAVEQTANGSWSAVQTTGRFCSVLVGSPPRGNLAVNRTMPAGGELFEYAIAAPGYPVISSTEVFYIN